MMPPSSIYSSRGHNGAGPCNSFVAPLSGKDAIRVCALYRTKDGTERGVVSDKRVHRVGEIDAVCERVIDRMRKCWTATKTVPRCPKCGAPQFKSKVRKDRYTGKTSGGNMVCADLCWKGAQPTRGYSNPYGGRDYPASPAYAGRYYR